MSTIQIDLNVRHADGTYAGFEHIEGSVPMVGDIVRVTEPESHLGGKAMVTKVDQDRQIVFLSLDWSTLVFDPPERVRQIEPTEVTFFTRRGFRTAKNARASALLFQSRNATAMKVVVGSTSFARPDTFGAEAPQPKVVVTTREG